MAAATIAEDDPSVQGDEPTSQEKQETLSQNSNAKQFDHWHWNLIFTQVNPYKRLTSTDTPPPPISSPTSFPTFNLSVCVAFTVYSNVANSGLTPVNPMCISSPPTGPMIYAVNKKFAEDYITMNPDGINVPLTNDVASATPSIHGHAYTYTKAKDETSSELMRQLTREKKQRLFPTTQTRAEIARIGLMLASRGPLPQKQQLLNDLDLEKLDAARKRSSKTAYNASQFEERITKQFFSQFKSGLV
eukprot:scaffold438_cov110-Isochrysis_galbana.AAC.9